MTTTKSRVSSANNDDLLIIPQFGITTPGEHLTPAEIVAVREDWHHYPQNMARPFEQTWTVSFAHLSGHRLVVTTTMDIPRMAR